MATVHYAPFSAIKYVGAKAKVFNTSLARPKPTLKKGDIVIVDKVTAFNLVKKGFGEFVMVDTIAFKKEDVKNDDNHNELEDEIINLKADNERLNQELLVALASLADTDVSIKETAPVEDLKVDEAFGVIPEVTPETLIPEVSE
ncbi:MAG: hypothetical protein NTW78_03840 [Campylobacterales bacterium]|nr:hypothetical protein [Campylobacterales bacterium]